MYGSPKPAISAQYRDGDVRAASCKNGRRRPVNIIFRSRFVKSTCFLPLIFSLLITSFLSLNFIANQKAAAPFYLLSGCCGWQWTPNDEIKNVVPSDVVDYILPNRFFIKDAIAEGSVPLWNSEILGGEVFLATTQSAVFHPINVFLFFLSPSTVQTISTQLAIFFTLFFTALMLRSLGLSRQASLVGAAALGLSSFALFWSPFGITWFIAAMSALLYMYNEWQKTGNNLFAVFIALVLGTQFYFGHIQFAFMVYLVLSSIVLYDLLANFKAASRKNVIIICAAAAAGIAIGAAQVLPFLEQAAVGHRAGPGAEATMDPAKDFASATQNMVDFFKPYVFQTENEQQYFRELGIYTFNLGLIVACFTLVAVFAHTKRIESRKPYFICLVIVGLFWSWGSLPHLLAGAIAPSFKQLNPRYFIAIAIFGAAVLAGIGYDGARSFLRTRRMKTSKLITWVTYASALELALISALYFTRLWHPYQVPSKLATAMGLSVLSFWVLAQSRSKLVKQTFQKVSSIFLITFIVVEGVVLFNSIVPANKKALLEKGNPYYETIVADANDPNHRNIRIVTPYAPNTNMYYGLSVLNGYEPLYAKRIETFTDNLNFPMQTRKLAAANAIYVDNVQKDNVLKSLGVKYIIAEKNRNVPGYSTMEQVESYAMALYKSDTSVGQIYLADKVTRAGDSEQAEAIRNNAMQQKEVFIREGGVHINPVVDTSGDSVTYDIGINKIKAVTQSSKRNLLFIAQNYHDGWSAKVDGKVTPINRATVNFMAIEVPEGHHSVELAFLPNSFRYGAVITGLSILALMAVLVCSWRRRGFSVEQ